MSISGFKPPGNDAKEQHTQASHNFAWYFVLSYSKHRQLRKCGHRAQNLLVLRSPQMIRGVLACKQRVSDATLVIGLAVAGSARPAPLPLIKHKGKAWI